MSQELNTKRIQRYLNDAMTTHELDLFREEMERDPNLKREVEQLQVERKIMAALIKQEYAEKIKNLLPPIDQLADEIERQEKKQNNLDKESEIKVNLIKKEDYNKIGVDVPSMNPTIDQIKGQLESKRVFKVRMYLRWAVAAILTLSIGLGSWYWLSDNYSNQRLVYDYYRDPDRDLFSNFRHIPENPTYNAVYESGKKAYQNEQYQKAIDSFNKLPPTEEYGHYFLAHSYFKSGDMEMALKVFRSVAALHGRYQEKAEYFQMLCHIGTSRLDEEFESLIESLMSNHQHSFNQEAIQLNGKVSRDTR